MRYFLLVFGLLGVLFVNSAPPINIANNVLTFQGYITEPDGSNFQGQITTAIKLFTHHTLDAHPTTSASYEIPINGTTAWGERV